MIIIYFIFYNKFKFGIINYIKINYNKINYNDFVIVFLYIKIDIGRKNYNKL